MLSGLHYTDDGGLRDDTGHAWQRGISWVQPGQAENLVRSGTRYVVQRCQTAPYRGAPERFKRDVLDHMITMNEARSLMAKQRVPTVMVGELWHSERDG